MEDSELFYQLDVIICDAVNPLLFIKAKQG